MLNKGYKKEEEMEMIAGMTEGLRNFAERYNISINDPDLIRKYRMITDGERDVATRISAAVAKAEKKTNLENARKMKSEGVAEDIISRVTGLSPEKISKL